MISLIFRVLNIQQVIIAAKNLTCIWASQVVLVVKKPPANAGDIRDESLFFGLGRSLREGPGNQCQYSCLENPMGRGA